MGKTRIKKKILVCYKHFWYCIFCVWGVGIFKFQVSSTFSHTNCIIKLIFYNTVSCRNKYNTRKKNIIEKMQTGVLSIIREKNIPFQVPKHVDDPRTDYPHFFILVKVFVSIRLKHYCKVFRETKLDKKVRKKLSKLVLFKNQ